MNPTTPLSSDTQLAEKTTWSSRYVGISLVLVGLCFPAIWVYVGYRGYSFNELLSFKADDGWCIKGVESVANHCFGDYSLFAAGNLWDPTQVTTAGYPPLALVPPVLAIALGRVTGSWALGRDIFLLLLVGSLLAPAIWVAHKKWLERGPILFVILGVATAPFLVVMDRGNTTALLVAPLLGVAISYLNAEYRRMVVFIVICTLLKPQMVILVLLFLVYRRYKDLLLTVVVSTLLTLASFLFLSGSFFENVFNWLHAVGGYQGARAPDSMYPYNLSFMRSIVTVFDLSHLQSLVGVGVRSELVSLLKTLSPLLSITVVAMLIFAILARKGNTRPLYPFVAVCIAIAIAPGTSYGYYLVLMLVPAALVLRDPDRDATRPGTNVIWSGMLDRNRNSDSGVDRFYPPVLILGLGLLLTPLVVPISSFPILGSDLPTASPPMGLLQILWGPILTTLFFLTIAAMLFRPSEGLTAALGHEITQPDNQPQE